MKIRHLDFRPNRQIFWEKGLEGEKRYFLFCRVFSILQGFFLFCKGQNIAFLRKSEICDF